MEHGLELVVVTEVLQVLAAAGQVDTQARAATEVDRRAQAAVAAEAEMAGPFLAPFLRAQRFQQGVEVLAYLDKVQAGEAAPTVLGAP